VELVERAIKAIDAELESKGKKPSGRENSRASGETTIRTIS